MQYKRVHYIEIWDVPRPLWEYIWYVMVGVDPVCGETTFSLSGETLKKVNHYDLNDMPEDIFALYLKLPGFHAVDLYILTVEK